MIRTLLVFIAFFSLNLNATNGNLEAQDREDLTLAVSYTTYNYDQDVMQIIFANLNESNVKYKIFSDNERLKSVGGFQSTAGMNYVNIDITYYESGNYILEMNDGETETVYYFNVNRPK